MRVMFFRHCNKIKNKIVSSQVAYYSLDRGRETVCHAALRVAAAD